MSFSALLVALAVSLLPTALYLGLWRGLVRLRENALARYGDPSEVGRPTGSGGAPPRSASSSSPAAVTCPNCGADSEGYARFCATCLRKL